MEITLAFLIGGAVGIYVVIVRFLEDVATDVVRVAWTSDLLSFQVRAPLVPVAKGHAAVRKTLLVLPTSVVLDAALAAVVDLGLETVPFPF